MGGGRPATRGRDRGASGRSIFREGVPAALVGGRGHGLAVPAERFLPDLLPRFVVEDSVVVEGCDEVIPRRAGVPPGGGRHIRVAPGEVGHKSARLAPVPDVPVEEGQ